MITRRGLLAGILASGFAPAAIGSGILMPVRKIAVPSLIRGPGWTGQLSWDAPDSFEPIGTIVIFRGPNGRWSEPQVVHGREKLTITGLAPDTTYEFKVTPR